MADLYKQECKSFSPSIDDKSKILILGSMPSVKSLNEQQYYAHPQNRFWKLMAKLCNCDDLPDLNYKKKLHVLLLNKFALWDVIQFCNRSGSLDLKIQNEKPNNIPELLKQFSSIEIICFNGNKSYSTFKKFFPELLKEYKCCKLPSTSPTNAKYKLENLYQVWNNAINETDIYN